MRVIVAGLGIQGYKRRKHAGKDYVASVDPLKKEAEYRKISDVPLDTYDAVMACIPDEPKVELTKYALSNSKHVLVEKPLWAAHDGDIEKLERLARKNKVVCYIGYNHRFEPHFVRMRNLILSGKLGEIYSCRMFYGNGTARLVRNNEWRDHGGGVLPDLGSHLLDTCRFWFGSELKEFRLTAAHLFENQAPDHIIISSEKNKPRIELEMTFCMWRNHFTCDILAEKGSAHIESLCKWGPSIFSHRNRVLPSGRPEEEQKILIKEDPTWELEYAHFKKLVERREKCDLSNDFWLQKTLQNLIKETE